MTWVWAVLALFVSGSATVALTALAFFKIILPVSLWAVGPEENRPWWQFIFTAWAAALACVTAICLACAPVLLGIQPLVQLTS